MDTWPTTARVLATYSQRMSRASFDPESRSQLLSLPRVGKGVLTRLENAGLTSLETLAKCTVNEVLTMLQQQQTGGHSRSDETYWEYSSKARTSISVVLRFARESVAH